VIVEGGAGQARQILVLDVQPVWIRAVESILLDGGFAVDSTTSTDEALTMIDRGHFDVLMIGTDSMEPDFDWPGYVERAHGLAPDAKVIVVSTDEDSTVVQRALDASADAFVAKRARPEDLLFAVREVFAPDVYQVPPTPPEAESGLASSSREAGLTPRESTILALLAQGRSNAEIARALAIGEPTVKGHLWRLYRKIGVSNRTAAARWIVDHDSEGAGNTHTA
jgi:DNA-binding NarL/FixJ family response regulator